MTEHPENDPTPAATGAGVQLTGTSATDHRIPRSSPWRGALARALLRRGWLARGRPVTDQAIDLALRRGPRGGAA